MKSYLKMLAILAIVLMPAALAAQEENRFINGDIEFSMVNSVWSTPSESQGRTGTCWCFSTTSFLESEVYRMTGEKYQLSEIFTVYHAYKEKGKRYLRLWGNNNLGQGGLSHDLEYLIPKYGMVRKSDYSGMLPDQEGHDHSALFNEFRNYLQDTLKERNGFPNYYQQECDRILSEHLGAPPAEIVVDGETVTPIEFARDHLKFDAENYIEITSYSYMPFYTQGELLVPDNWMRNDEYYNLPLDEMVAIAKHALKNGYSFVVDLDVSEKTNLGRTTGIKYMPQDLEGILINQQTRDELFDSMETTDDHLMHTTGLATDESGHHYFYTRDSGGQGYGPYQGFNYISENYFRGKVLAIFLHKDAVPEDIRIRLGIE